MRIAGAPEILTARYLLQLLFCSCCISLVNICVQGGKYDDEDDEDGKDFK